MADDEPAIVIAARRDDRPGGPGTLTARTPTSEPDGTLWFGAELDSTGDQVWFRITAEAVRRMLETTPEGRGRHLLDALHVWLAADRSLKCGINRFEVRVSEAGDTWIEQLRW